MSFHFPLESVLRFRKTLEAREEKRLLDAYRQVQAVESRIEIVENALRGRRSILKAQLIEGLSGAEVQFDGTCESVLHAQVVALTNELKLRVAAREEQRQRFVYAHRQRLVLEQLRTRAQRLYVLEEERKAQRNMDDAFLLRREFLKRS